MKKIVILFIIIISISHLDTFSQNTEEIKVGLNRSYKMEGETLLNEFIIDLKPNQEKEYSVMLDKKTLYAWHTYLAKKNQLEIKLFDSKHNLLFKNEKSDKAIIRFTVKNDHKQLYRLHFKNISEETVTTVAYLTYRDINKSKKVEANTNAVLNNLLDAAGKDTYLKDFPFELKPGEEIQFPVQLNKRTLYNWYANMKNYKQFRITVYDKYGNTIYRSKDETVGIFNFSTKSNKDSKYILNIKNTSDKSISSTILLTYSKKLKSNETIVQNPLLEKLLNASNDIYLKDFSINLDPNKEARYSLVLSKNTTYSLSIYQNKVDQFEIKLYNHKTRQLIHPKTLNINKQILYNIYNISKTAVYEVIVKNKSPKPVESVVLLSFVDKFYNTEPEEEVVAITSQASSQKEKDSFQSNDTQPETEEIYFIVEDMPKFNGKKSIEFKDYVQRKLKYPQEAIDKKINGRVFIQFTVDKSGYVKDAKVVRSLHPSLDQEVLRVVYSSPKWEPGRKNGNPVNISFTFPIVFKLP